MGERDCNLEPAKTRFLNRCFEIVEQAVEDKKIRMKDVAISLGISSQVASKIVNPSDSRTLTAFEIFRMSVLLRKPVTELIPPEMYLTPNEMDDEELCRILGGTRDDARDGGTLAKVCRELPDGCRCCAVELIRVISQRNQLQDDGPYEGH